MKKIDNIKRLYGQIIDKNAVIEAVASDKGNRPDSIRVNWFSLWRIPEADEDRVIKILQNAIRLQIKHQNRLLK